MQNTVETLAVDEFKILSNWFDTHAGELPEPIVSLLKRLLVTYSKLTASKSQQKKLLAEINKLMGFTASSEKGSSEKCPIGL